MPPPTRIGSVRLVFRAEAEMGTVAIRNLGEARSPRPMFGDLHCFNNVFGAGRKQRRTGWPSQPAMRMGRINVTRVIRGGLSTTSPLQLFEVGELLHQLLHAVPGKEDGELCFVAIALAHHDLAFAIFAVADALAFFKT